MKEVKRTQTYKGPTREEIRKAKFDEGRNDRLNGRPCMSANGSYLDGWYSITKDNDNVTTTGN